MNRNLISKILYRRSSAKGAPTCMNFVRHHMGGIPGENLPFRFDNRFTLTLKFIIFFCSASWSPYLVVAYQLQKS